METAARLRTFPHHRLAACLSIALSLLASQVHGDEVRVSGGGNALRRLAHRHTQHDVAIVRDARLPVHPAGSDAVVTNCNDAGAGSLRDALEQAQPGQYWTVDLTQLQCSLISLESGALGISPSAQDVELFGPSYGSYRDGKPAPTLTIDANYADRVFVNVYPQVRLDLHDLRLINGRFTGSGTVAASRPAGGCIYSAGYLSLYESVVSNCLIVGADVSVGGGIYAHSGLSLDRSTVTANLATVSPGGYTYGGGIFSAATAAIYESWIANNGAGGISYGGGLVALDNVNIGNSTISGNTAIYDAGIGLFGLNGGTYSDIYQSTIANNQATQGGVGAIGSGQTLHVEYSTIASNVSPSTTLAGGIELESNAALTLVGTIVANNGGNDIGGSGTITGAKNLVTSSTLALPSDTIMLDPQLRPLADNGGLTLTMALSPGSPAIDAGYCFWIGSPPPYDQRIVQYDDNGNPIGHFQRVVGPCEDIGAFEFGAGDIFANGFD